MQLDSDILAAVIADAIKSSTASLEARIAVLEAREIPAAVVGEKGEPGRDGKDAEPVDLDALVAKVLALVPLPKDGEKGEPGINGKDGADGLNGKDGIGLAGALLTKDGLLAVTLSDGAIVTLGTVIGRDGEKGADGLPGAAGANGLNGKDGTLENIYPVLEDRTLKFYYDETDTPIAGWAVKMPMMIDRGVYDSEKTYEVGDVLSYGGSSWICKADCQGKQPGTDAGGPFWRLAVKRGNDGKPGTKGMDGKDGKPGPPGRDGTRSY